MRNINSLKNTSQFKAVYEHGVSAVSSLLVVYVLLDDDKEQRLGISVSKKVGNSVVRHRITRLIRECFVQLRPDLVPGCNIVVAARVRARDKSFSDIYGAMKYLCKKLNIYKTDIAD